MSYALFLRLCIIMTGVTIKEFAKRINWSYQGVHNFLQEKYPATPEFMTAVKEELNIDTYIEYRRFLRNKALISKLVPSQEKEDKCKK